MQPLLFRSLYVRMQLSCQRGSAGNWNLSENSVSILFVGDGFPVPLHSSLFTATPNPFGRFPRLLREAKRLPYALTNSNLSVRFDENGNEQ